MVGFGGEVFAVGVVVVVPSGGQSVEEAMRPIMVVSQGRCRCVVMYSRVWSANMGTAHGLFMILKIPRRANGSVCALIHPQGISHASVSFSPHRSPHSPGFGKAIPRISSAGCR